MERVTTQTNLGKRMIAFLIDHSLFSMILVTPFIMLLTSDSGPKNFATAFSYFNLMMFIAFLMYLIKDIFGGVSIGKWFLGLGVRDADDLNIVPSIGRLILRNLLTFVWPIEFIAILVSKRKLGDKFARTIVIDGGETSSNKRIAVAVGGVVLVFAVFFFGILFSLTNSDAYHSAIRHIEQDRTIAEVTGGVIGYGWVPMGSIQISNGQGYGEFSISVKGKKKDIEAFVTLSKSPGLNWQVDDIKTRN